MENKPENQQSISDDSLQLEKVVASAETTISLAKERVNNTFGNLPEDNKKRAAALIEQLKELKKLQSEQNN